MNCIRINNYNKNAKQGQKTEYAVHGEKKVVPDSPGMWAHVRLGNFKVVKKEDVLYFEAGQMKPWDVPVSEHDEGEPRFYKLAPIIDVETIKIPLLTI